MAESCLLIEVRWEWDGTETIADLALGDTSAVVENITTLSVDTDVWIGDDGPYTILDLNEDTSVITFTPAIAAAVDEGVPVVPDIGGAPAQVWVAEVVLVDSETPIEVPMTIQNLAVMPEGEYDPPKVVLISDDYQQIVDMPGSVPVVAGTYVEPPIDLWGATPIAQHEAAVAAIESDFQDAYDAIAAGDTLNDQAIAAAVADAQVLTNRVNGIDGEMDAFQTSLNTKSVHTLSPNEPGATANNAGDVWERHAAGVPTSIIGRWRGAGGTAWTAMNLDATYIPQLDIGTGTFGDLTGTRIVASSIGVDKLLVGVGINSIANPGAEMGATTAPHVVYGGAWAVDAVMFRSGAHSFRCYVNAPSISYLMCFNGLRQNVASKIPVAVGDVVRASMWVKSDPGLGAQMYVFFDLLRADGSVITNTNGTAVAGEVTNRAATTTFEKIASEVTVTNPECVYVGLALAAGGMVSIGDLYVDDVFMAKKGTGELIVDGSIVGRQIAANSIAAEKLVITDFTNYVTDTSMDDLGTWALSAGVAYATAFPRVGDSNNKHLRFTTTGAEQTATEPKFDVVAGEYYNGSVLCRRGGDLQASGYLYWRVLWYDSAGTYLSYNDVNVLVNTLTTHDWVRLEFDAVAPAGAAQAAVQMIAWLIPAGGAYDFDLANFRRRFGGELIVDGSIRARHITADMVNGLIITGSAIQTSDQGAPSTWVGANLPKGVKISDSGLAAYSSGIGLGAAPLGTATGSIDANTGRWSAVGGLATATGYDDISITAGDASTPAAVKFISDGVGIDNIFPATLSMRDGTYTLGGQPSYFAELVLQGAKYGTAGVGGVPRARIEIGSARQQANASNTQSDITYRAGHSGPFSAGHYFVINTDQIAQVRQNGLNLSPGMGLTVGNVFPIADGIYAAGVIKSSAGVHSDTGFYDLGVAGGGLTTASIENTGRIIRTVSSERFKQDIEPLSLDTARVALDLEAVTFQWRDTENMGSRRMPGFIAEQAHAAGAGLWVTYEGDDPKQAPGGFRYPELTAAHNVLIRDLYARLEALEGA